MSTRHQLFKFGTYGSEIVLFVDDESGTWRLFVGGESADLSTAELRRLVELLDLALRSKHDPERARWELIEAGVL